MPLRKQGTVLMSTVIILSLMSMLGCFMFTMMKNNNELGYLYEFDKDVYDLNKNDEQLLNKFMKELNKENQDNLNNENEGKDIFSEDFEKEIEGSRLEYQTGNGTMFFITKKEDDLLRKREIKHKYKNQKIMLIPTYKFEDYTE